MESDCCFAVLIPMYNEESTIRPLLERVASQNPAEIIVVDDGSSDACGSLATEWLESNDQGKLLRHPSNRGKGAAIRTGLQQVTAPFVIIQDADLEYDPDEFAELIAPLTADRVDVVYGSRYRGYGITGLRKCDTLDALMGLWAVRFLNLSVWLLYRFWTTDEATCYKAFRTDVLRAFDLECKGFEFCPEVTAKTARSRLRYAEIPIGYQRRNSAAGKKIRARDFWVALQTLWKYRNWRPQPATPTAGANNKTDSNANSTRTTAIPHPHLTANRSRTEKHYE